MTGDLKRETLRYLGYGKSLPDENTDMLIDECMAELEMAAESRSTFLMEEDRVLFGATLGSDVDVLIRKESRRHVAKAAILQAAAAALIEEYCDECQRMINLKLNEEGKGTLKRFSPGYGDFGLENQREIFSKLQLPKKIGLTLTDSLLMVPTKSVTAIMPIVSIDRSCDVGKNCSTCPNTECEFRQE